MWDQDTDRMFLNLRDDAVLIFGRQSLRLIYLNPAAKTIFPEALAEADFSSLFPEQEVKGLLNAALSNDRVHGLYPKEQPWFTQGGAVLHAVRLEWDGIPAVALTVDRRAYGPPPEALDLMTAVLNSAYFISLRIDLHAGNAGVISDKNTLMSTQAHFPSCEEFLSHYAEAVIHPEDRTAFLNAFSDAQLRLFQEQNIVVPCNVRRMADHEYRWASFTLSAAGNDILLLLGKDSNESHLQQEELESVSLRNDYILTSISDIFRLMLHIDLTTGDTVICSMHADVGSSFSIDTVYQFQDVVDKLIGLVHPDDRASLRDYLTLDSLCGLMPVRGNKISIEYRRIDPDGDPDQTAKWTRSVLTLTAFDSNQRPTEAVYAVQDIDLQKRQELEAKRRQETLTSQFYTVIRNRYLWFAECDYQAQIAHCYRIQDNTVLPPDDCPFGQFFERIIMPNCHPEDYKRVAMAMLPTAAAENYRLGKHQVTIDYRQKYGNGWRYVRAEIYMQQESQDGFRTMIYVSDIDDEIKSQIYVTQSEHEQLMLRRRIDSMIHDSVVYISEVDPDADVITHYQFREQDQINVTGTDQFSRFCDEFPERFVHPEHRSLFRQYFSYDQILRAAREHQTEVRHLFLLDLQETGNYIWCSFAVRFFRNEIGRSYLMVCAEDMNEIIQKRDANLHAVYAAKEKLQEHIREAERSRIRRAHVFMNIFSSLQLGLNRLYSNLDSLNAETAKQQPELTQMYQTYEQLSSMTECAKNMLLLENNQLTLLNQPMSFLSLFHKIRRTNSRIFEKKEIHVISYATHVTNETVFCDGERLTFLIDQIFCSLIRALPDRSSVTLQLAQSPLPDQSAQAVYEFSLVTRCLQKRAAPDTRDPFKAIEADFLINDPNYQPHNLYFCKRLIAMMHGALEYVKMPNHSCAVLLRLPLTFVRQQIIFPLRHTFGKRALVWDSRQPAAIATMEMLRESGMQSDWHADYESVMAYLKLAGVQGKNYDLIILRASDLRDETSAGLNEIVAYTGNIPVFIISDDPMLTPTAFRNFPTVRLLWTPVFRSTLADALRDAFDQ